MVSRVIPVDPFDLVIFGGTGDLARRKILPGLYRRFRDGQIPDTAQMIGAARTEMDAEAYREEVAGALKEFLPADVLDKKTVKAFLARVDYVATDATGTGGWKDLKNNHLEEVNKGIWIHSEHVEIFLKGVEWADLDKGDFCL